MSHEQGPGSPREPKFDLLSVHSAVTLAEELHFGRAAARHFMTPQAFGRRIQRLERALGYQLFERTSRVVTITPRGRRVLTIARHALDRLSSLADEPDHAADDGALTVGVLGFGIGARWADFETLLRQAVPRAPLHYAELNLADQYQELLAGAIDAAVIQHTEDIEEIHFSATFAMDRVLVVPARSELADATLLTPADVGTQTWLRMDLPGVHQAHERPLGRQVGPAVRSPAAIPMAVAMTGAVAHHVVDAAEYFARPDVRYIPYRDQPMTMGIATRADDRRPVIESFRHAAELMSLVDLERERIRRG
ncbi:LysR family transcriptional regulator [Kutzneria sp. NPDC052558]|uniref:LysR family transcriptional regulator n=1 Tax=Kutzneria sp. NPDC052558 TaxID=3364121 RepID=UPI0037CB4E12